MRKTIKSLEQQLEHREQSVRDEYQKRIKAEKERDEAGNMIRAESIRADRAVADLFFERQKQEKMLVDIIRWLINPDAAADPFNEVSHAASRAALRDKGIEKGFDPGFDITRRGF